MSRGVSGKLSLAKTRSLLELMTEEVPALRRRAGVPVDTCVLHTHLAVEVVRVAGGRARPFAVRVKAASPEMARRIDAGQPVPLEDDAAEVAEWRAAGAVGVAIGYGAENGAPVEGDRYDGHLVALVAERYIIDLTADQIGARRGEIHIPPFWTEVPREFVRGEASVEFVSPDGSVATYHPNPTCRDYLRPINEVSTWRTEEKTAAKLLRAIGWRG